MKDYLSEKEAAAYCCVSPSHFRAKLREIGLRPGKLWGKNIYRRTDLQALIEKEAWPQSNGENTVARTARSRGRLRSIGSREA